MKQSLHHAALVAFANSHHFRGKGALSVALVITRQAMEKGLPLDPGSLITEGGGQVLGLGRGAVQSILEYHGITRVLAAEGGRTSRGSLANMRQYVSFLNELQAKGDVDLKSVESFWVERVKEFFSAKPLQIRIDASRGLRAVVRDVIKQAEDRQKAGRGVQYAGAVLQHLVGAKLDCALGVGHFHHNSFSTADTPGDRPADFLVEDTAIHVTTAPGEALIQRCRQNLDEAQRPIIVTTSRGADVAEGLAANLGISDRLDVFEIEQFVALNIYEFGGFAADGRKDAIENVVARYNEIVDECETDPSLRIATHDARKS